MSSRKYIDSEEQVRYLLLHDGTGELFVLHSKRQYKQALSEGCDDVTGNKFYEDCFIHKIHPYEAHAKIEKEKMMPPVQRRAVAKSVVPFQPDLPLHLKYRPTKLEEVIGQDEVVKSLQKSLVASSRPHSFLFTGPSGCGKTTLARIVATMLGCDPSNVTEADAATNTGIDAARELLSGIRYMGLGNSPNKMYIIDEVHMLSKQAWASLLKTIEEPPAHAYFALCTTDEGKIPEAIKTRCMAYNLKPVKYDPLMDLLEMVVDEEKLDPFDGLLEMIARACNGSPRQALVMLAMTMECDDEKEAARLLEAPLEDKEIIDLCRMLIKGDLTWDKVTKTLKAIPESNPESIRIVIVNYLNSCLIGSTSDKNTMRLLDIQAQFLKPSNTSDKMAPILQAFGNIIYPA